MRRLGTPAPDFKLPDVVTGRVLDRASIAGLRGLLVMFICRHCPYVRHVQAELASLGADYKDSGVGIVAISSNDAKTHPQDAPASLAEMAREAGFTFPFLHDETQEVARDYDAQCTPDFFLYDANGLLVYRGQLDDSRPGNGRPVTGRDLRGAMDALVRGQAISADQKPSVGCNIKWKSEKS